MSKWAVYNQGIVHAVYKKHCAIFFSMLSTLHCGTFYTTRAYCIGYHIHQYNAMHSTYYRQNVQYTTRAHCTIQCARPLISNVIIKSTININFNRRGVYIKIRLKMQ